MEWNGLLCTTQNGLCRFVVNTQVMCPVHEPIIPEAQSQVSQLLFLINFPHGAMGRRIDPSWGGPIELFLVPASAPRLV